MRKYVIPFNRWENRGAERLSICLKATQLVSGRAGTWTQAASFGGLWFTRNSLLETLFLGQPALQGPSQGSPESLGVPRGRRLAFAWCLYPSTVLHLDLTNLPSSHLDWQETWWFQKPLGDLECSIVVTWMLTSWRLTVHVSNILSVGVYS